MNIKLCTSCKLEKPLSDFNKKKCRKDGLQSSCRQCNSEYKKQYYRDNEDCYKEKVKKGKEERRRASLNLAREYLQVHPCVDCGEADIRKLEFDHVRGKKRLSVCQMIQEGYSSEAVSEEIEKCEVRCGSCHMVKTWPTRWQFT